MNVKFLALLIGLTLFASAVKAEDAGLEAAEKVCGKISFNADKVTECLKIVNAARYFDGNAVEVCKNLSFNSDVTISCLTTIKDLRFSETGVKTCKDLSFNPANVMECLKVSGRPLKPNPEGKLDKDFVIANLRKALRSLHDGDEDRAERIIRNTIEGLE